MNGIGKGMSLHYSIPNWRPDCFGLRGTSSDAALRTVYGLGGNIDAFQLTTNGPPQEVPQIRQSLAALRLDAS